MAEPDRSEPPVTVCVARVSVTKTASDTVAPTHTADTVLVTSGGGHDRTPVVVAMSAGALKYSEASAIVSGIEHVDMPYTSM